MNALNYATSNAEWQSTPGLASGTTPRTYLPDTLWSPSPESEVGQGGTAVGEAASPPATSARWKSTTLLVPSTLLAEWSGYVVELNDHYFSAALKGSAQWRHARRATG